MHCDIDDVIGHIEHQLSSLAWVDSLLKKQDGIDSENLQEAQIRLKWSAYQFAYIALERLGGEQTLKRFRDEVFRDQDPLSIREIAYAVSVATGRQVDISWTKAQE